MDRGASGLQFLGSQSQTRLKQVSTHSGFSSVILSRKNAYPLFSCEKKLFSYKNKWNIMGTVITKFIKCWEGEKKQR